VHRIANVALALLGAVVFGLAGYVVLRDDHPPRGAAAGPPSSPPALTPTGSSGPPRSGPPGTSAPAVVSAPVVAFLGDDWTAGTGASRSGARFTTRLSRRLDLRERNFGADGSGYAKSGPDAGPYRTRLDDVVAAHPDVVVVSGGRNDRADDPATAAARARALFAALHARLPASRIVALAPWWGDSSAPGVIVDLGRAVRNGVTAVGGTYLDLPDPLYGHPEFMADDADPNDRGYAAIADAVAGRLRAALAS